MSKIQLEETTFYIQRVLDIPRENIDVQFFPSLECWDGMGLRLVARIWGETIDIVHYPSTWWDAFKVRWFPAWLKRRFPPRFTEIKAKALYPKVSIPSKLSKIVLVESEDYATRI